MRMTIETTLPQSAVEQFHQLYRDAFEPLRTRAAARHLLDAEEFAAEMADPRIEKYVMWDEQRPVALTTLTTDLSAVSWISPDFFIQRYPEQAARGAIFYLGYTLVHPAYEGQAIYGRAIARLARRLKAADGVMAFDVCGYNDQTRSLAAGIRRLSRSIDVRLDTVDVQTYYAAVSIGPRKQSDAGADGLRTVSVAQRPDLAERIPEVMATRWPTFVLAGTPGHGVDPTVLISHAPQHQILLVDEHDDVLGVGLSTPLRWNGTVEDLPAGWDDMVASGVKLLLDGDTPTAVSALSVTLSPAAAGRRLAVRVIEAMKDAARARGVNDMLVPVRPVWKPRYPLVPIERYIAWRTDDGRVFDPWLRIHQEAGARVLTIAHQSMTIAGNVREWESWTGLAMPETGSYLVPGGLAAVEIDRERDHGVYQEPNVWVAHRL